MSVELTSEEVSLVLAEKRKLAKEALAGAHLIINDLSALPRALVLISLAIQEGLRPEQIQKLEAEDPNSEILKLKKSEIAVLSEIAVPIEPQIAISRL